jgi:serine/threonine protein kinase/formylglycine-generating enzyme required for sulfatase activity
MSDSSGSNASPGREPTEAAHLASPASSGASDFEVRPPDRIGRFELDFQLGHGGYGCVYKAIDTSLGRVVAIKVPRWDRPLRADAFERFLNEGRALAKVLHPAIVSVFDVGRTDDGLPFVVMEFVEGKSLRDILRNESMDVRESVDLLLQIGEGLQVAHSNALIHRDLKPGNIIVNSEGQIKLVDFGLALHDDLCWSDLSTDVVGTPSYMAPEQIRGENHRIDGQTDIWSFGVIMYRLLTGKMPFRAKSHADLARQICYRQPMPPRQLNADTPLEIQRICLRCLSKRLVDRYPSMTDVLDELRAAKRDLFEVPAASGPSISDPLRGLSASGQEPSGSTGTNAPSSPSQGSQTASSMLALNSGLIIVPKGLHSFSENDAEFFLHLLPGPRDRRGMPESVRFWTTQIGSRTSGDGAIGLIYGPSGCGKSSFVRAGLFPHLPASVLPVYIDCAGRDTEQRLVRQIQRVVETVDPGDDLVAMVRQLRTADHLHAGDKVLLVLDQFEQWLSAHGRYAGQVMTEALRQCNGQSVACLLLVRDDFWMSVGEFLSELEVPIAEGRNAMSLPLFDETHARDVLAAIGRSHGRLPPDHRQLTRPQRQFLRDAVDLLSSDGKVICVHLAVLAEMMKDREWTAAELRRLGGLSGVGVRFLEDTFSSPLSRPEARRCEPVARNILEQLIPTTGATIKGPIRTEGELQKGLKTHAGPDEFQRGLHFLADDIKIIASVESATDPAQRTIGGSARAVDAPERFYQLAHDFLVEPIRQWLHNKKLSHWRGRAELQLQSLGDQWNARNDPRYFPGGMDLLRMLWGVDAASRARYDSFLRAARRRYLVYATAALVLLGIALGLFALSRQQVNQNEAIRRADRFLQADPADVPDAIGELKPYVHYAEPRVRAALDATNPRQKLHAHYFAVGNLAGGDQLIAPLIGLLDEGSVVELRNVIQALRAYPDASREALRERLESGTDERHQSLLANLLTELDDTSGIAHALQLRPDPTLRTTYVHSFDRSPHDIERLVRQLDSVADYDIHSGMILALGGLDPAQLSPSEHETCLRYFERIFRSVEASGGAHSAAEWALLRWGESEIVDSLEGPTEPSGPWFIRHIDDEALTFVRLPAGQTQLGVGKPEGVRGASQTKPELVRFTGFYISTTPVTEHMFMAMMVDFGFGFVPDPLTPGRKLGPDVGGGRRGYPFADADWSDAVQFCNWLARQQSNPECYVQEGDNVWTIRAPSRPTYRLPTSAEWEYAYRCLALTGTPYCRELNLSVLQHYSWYGQPETGHCRHKMPTAWGLFDFPANTLEWSNDAFGDIELQTKIARGGHNMSSLETLLACSFYRLPAQTVQTPMGIRIVFAEQLDAIISREPLPASK